MCKHRNLSQATSADRESVCADCGEVVNTHGGSRPNAGRKPKPDAKKSWARKLSLDIIAYLDSTDNAVETLETTVRASKKYKQWKANRPRKGE